jgi:hypothetical protein
VRRKGLAVAAATDAAEAPGLIEPLLLPLRTEEPPIPQLAKYSRPLHLGLKSLQKLIAVFSITERYVCQVSVFSIFSKQIERAAWHAELIIPLLRR